MNSKYISLHSFSFRVETSNEEELSKCFAAFRGTISSRCPPETSHILTINARRRLPGYGANRVIMIEGAGALFTGDRERVVRITTSPASRRLSPSVG